VVRRGTGGGGDGGFALGILSRTWRDKSVVSNEKRRRWRVQKNNEIYPKEGRARSPLIPSSPKRSVKLGEVLVRGKKSEKSEETRVDEDGHAGGRKIRNSFHG